MMKISIKREQSQAGLSFAERENRRSLAGGESNFRPQVKNKLLLLLALLLTAATGAWAQGGGDAAKYTKAVAISELKVGDILAQGASITGESSDKVKLDPNRSKFGNDVVGTEVGLNLTVSFGTNGTINNQYAPVTESGQDGDAWVVTNVKNQFGIYTVNLAGILMTGTAEPAASGYTVSMEDGVKDADKWTVKVGEGQAQALPIGGLKGDGSETVTLQYTGRLKVKGVKATSDAAPAAKEPATVTTAPTGAAIVGVGKTTALVSGGAAEGGTMMYKVTTENTKPASTDGFSDAVPTAKDITASGKVYVWYYVKGDDTHSDSEIAATAIEVPVADIVWDATNVSDLSVSGNSEPYEKEGVTLSCNANQISAAWHNYGDPTKDGISFYTKETGGFTFTAPTGKAFAKIEMKANGPGGWSNANLGTGWAFNNTTVTWTGSASTVDLLTGANKFNKGTYISYIAFYLSE